MGTKTGSKTRRKSSDDEGSWEKFDDGYDDEFIGDDADREWLEGLTEREREAELFKRSERRDEMKKRFEITRKLKLQQRNKGNDDDQYSREDEVEETSWEQPESRKK